MRKLKYEPLTECLLSSGLNEISMTFDEISKLVCGLPRCMLLNNAHWKNSKYDSASYGWLNAGYNVKADITSRIVTFSKVKAV